MTTPVPTPDNIEPARTTINDRQTRSGRHDAITYATLQPLPVVREDVLPAARLALLQELSRGFGIPQQLIDGGILASSQDSLFVYTTAREAVISGSFPMPEAAELDTMDYVQLSAIRLGCDSGLIIPNDIIQAGNAATLHSRICNVEEPPAVNSANIEASIAELTWFDLILFREVFRDTPRSQFALHPLTTAGLALYQQVRSPQLCEFFRVTVMSRIDALLHNENTHDAFIDIRDNILLTLSDAEAAASRETDAVNSTDNDIAYRIAGLNWNNLVLFAEALGETARSQFALSLMTDQTRELYSCVQSPHLHMFASSVARDRIAVLLANTRTRDSFVSARDSVWLSIDGLIGAAEQPQEYRDTLAAVARSLRRRVDAYSRTHNLSNGSPAIVESSSFAIATRVNALHWVDLLLFREALASNALETTTQQYLRYDASILYSWSLGSSNLRIAATNAVANRIERIQQDTARSEEFRDISETLTLSLRVENMHGSLTEGLVGVYPAQRNISEAAVGMSTVYSEVAGDKYSRNNGGSYTSTKYVQQEAQLLLDGSHGNARRVLALHMNGSLSDSDVVAVLQKLTGNASHTAIIEDVANWHAQQAAWHKAQSDRLTKQKPTSRRMRAIRIDETDCLQKQNSETL